MSKIPTIALNNRVKMPILDLDIYLIDNNCPKVIKVAIDIGYRHFDTDQYYGNEKEVGEDIKLSNVPRSEIFITTKLKTSGYQSSKKGIESSLKRLGFFILI